MTQINLCMRLNLKAQPSKCTLVWLWFVLWPTPLLDLAVCTGRFTSSVHAGVRFCTLHRENSEVFVACMRVLLLHNRAPVILLVVAYVANLSGSSRSSPEVPI